jgi:hypothetical protein
MKLHRHEDTKFFLELTQKEALDLGTFLLAQAEGREEPGTFSKPAVQILEYFKDVQPIKKMGEIILGVIK